MRYWLIPLFQAGELQSIYFLECGSQDVWRYYSIARTGKNASALTAGHDASFINRAVAFYRYLAGIPIGQGAHRVAMNWLPCNVSARVFPLINPPGNQPSVEFFA